MMNLLASSLSLFHYVSSPVAEMRQEPRQDCEIVSQAYYSEKINILEEASEWVKIETAVDQYQGWVQSNTVCHRNDLYLSNSSNPVVHLNRRAAHLYHVQDTTYGPIMTLPFESRLEVLEPKEESNSRWLKVQLVDGRQAYIQRGDVKFNLEPLTRDEMCSLSLQFLGLPYTWGGRSSFGYDCSGFTQMLYRQMGIYLPRDSKDQLHWDGFVSIPTDQLQPGDLVFFGLAEDKIRHVGFYLGEDQFIHATVAENAPYIRISRLSEPEWNGSARFKYCAARTLRPR